VSRLQRFRLRHLARTRLWLLPVICVLAGIWLAVGLLAIDRSSGYDIVGTSVTGSGASVQTILSTASTSLVTLTSVLLSLTLVAVQLAMGQFSPRIVRTILQDRRSQLAVGLFVGTFAYSMTVLREIKSSGPAPVPGLAVVVNYGLIVSAIVVLRPRTIRASWSRPTTASCTSCRTTSSWTSPGRPSACSSSCPPWVTSSRAAGRSSACRARSRSRSAGRSPAA
jgi:hypothetical protein